MTLLALRMAAQWLATRPGTSTAEVAAHCAGLQAQDTAAVRLAVRARSATLTAADVRSASASGDVVRTWLMRGTLHLVPSEDAGWLLSIFGPRNAAGGARRRRELGLTDDVCRRAIALLPEILGDGPRSRAQIVAALNGRGAPVNPVGQAPAHLVAYAAARGVLCRGPDLDRDEPGYVPLPQSGFVPDEETALALLTRRYLGGYGPAGAADLAAWSGLPLTVARRGLALIAAELNEVAPGEFVVDPAPRPPGPVLRLLGAYDNYLLGYRSRSAALPDRYAKRIQAGGGVIHPTVVVDGAVLGRWRTARRAGGLAVRVEPFQPLDPRLNQLLAAEVADLGRFLGVPAVLD
jgi:hypothetical protein